MISESTQLENELMNAIVYINYEKILELLKRYGKDPVEMDFFQVIQDKLRASSLNIVDCIVYINCEKKPRNEWQHHYIQSRKLRIRPASINGKDSGDLELTVDIMRVLYKNPEIQVFVIISWDRDIIPLLKEIKYENKISYLLSGKNGFNQVVAEYADFHEYLEEIFDLQAARTVEQVATELKTAVDFTPAESISDATAKEIFRAREVSRYLYRSQIWKRANQLGEPIRLNGYLHVISKIVNRPPENILADFKLAHRLKLVAIYQDQDGQLCLQQGAKKDQF